jgi:hypothetical protein
MQRRPRGYVRALITSMACKMSFKDSKPQARRSAIQGNEFGILFVFPLHCRRIRVLPLDPMRRSPRAVTRVPALRDYALKAQPYRRARRRAARPPRLRGELTVLDRSSRRYATAAAAFGNIMLCTATKYWGQVCLSLMGAPPFVSGYRSGAAKMAKPRQ